MLVTQMLNAKNQTADSITRIESSATIADACALLSVRRIGALVVSDDGRKVAGMISERDIVRELGIRGAQVLEAKVAELMTTTVETCGIGDDAMEVLDRMTRGRFRHLPVVDEDGHMIGLVSIGDAVAGRLGVLMAVAEALTGMIMGA